MHTPTPLSGGHVFRQIDGGVGSTCGVTPRGSAYCWGRGGRGQIGDGGNSARTVPTLVLPPAS